MAENPIKLYRLANDRTIKEQADEFGMTYITLLRLEQGLYNDIPPVIFDRLSNQQKTDFIDLYSQFQVQQRKQSRYLLVTPIPESWLTNHYQIHPFTFWRNASQLSSRLACCRAFCLHPSTVIAYEHGNVETTPNTINGALMEAGHTAETLTELGRRYQLWRHYIKYKEWPLTPSSKSA